MDTPILLVNVLLWLAMCNGKSYGGNHENNNDSQYTAKSAEDLNQQQLLIKIVYLLEDIANYIKLPHYSYAPPPPPIYIPYILPYPAPQYGFPHYSNLNSNGKDRISDSNSVSGVSEIPKVGVRQKEKVTLLTYSRFPDQDDNSNSWGLTLKDSEENSDDANDGSRPRSLDPIKPTQTLTRPTPEVDRDSIQLGKNITTAIPESEMNQHVSYTTNNTNGTVTVN